MQKHEHFEELCALTGYGEGTKCSTLICGCAVNAVRLLAIL